MAVKRSSVSGTRDENIRRSVSSRSFILMKHLVLPDETLRFIGRNFFCFLTVFSVFHYKLQSLNRRFTAVCLGRMTVVSGWNDCLTQTRATIPIRNGG